MSFDRTGSDEQSYLENFHESLMKEAVRLQEIEIPTDDEFFDLSDAIIAKDSDNNAKTNKSGSYLSYKSFKELKSAVPKSLQKYFTPTTFLQSSRNEHGEVNFNDILNLIQRSIDIERISIVLLKQLDPRRNWLDCKMTEKDVAMFIHSMISSIKSCRDIQDEFIPYYMITCARKFFFFLDSRRRGSVSVRNIANSHVMEELLYLRRLDRYEHDLDPKIYQEQLESNWFYHRNSFSLYSIFTSLDKDQNGLLNADELAEFSGTNSEPSTLTFTCCKRILETHVTNETRELDFVGFLNLVLALENKTSLPSLEYFWKIFNVDLSGRLTAQTIDHFYLDVQDLLNRARYHAAPSNVIVNEVFDLLNCNSTEGATFESFKKSGNGHLVASILTDASCFLAYENREVTMNQAMHGQGED